MADVSVEFGAKDTGLEQTLKTVQAQLTSLEEEVKSGTLSFDELQQTMRKIGQAEKVQDQLQAMATGVDAAGSAASAATPKVDAIGNEMKKTGNEAKDVGDKSEGGFLKMAAAVAAGQAAVNIATAAMKAAFNLVKGSIDEFGAALDLGGRLSDLSERTGETAGNLLLLERAFDNSGVGADKVGQSINKLQKFIEDAGTGAGPQIEVMNRLGLALGELAGKTPTEQMQTFAQKISSIEDPGKRAALAMEVFGRAGGELLPLLTNFSGEIGTAQGQLGGMVDVMNRNAATFDAVSDKVDIIGGKFMEFAAGVLDKVSPALDAVTEALSRIDAAAIGQKFADMFTGGISAMNGFQAAVDAFKTGNIEGALSLLWESVKLQAMQTADAVYKNLSAAFTTAGQVLGEVFRGDGPAMMVIKSAFDFIASYIKEKVAGALSEMFASMGPAFATISESLKQHAEAGATSAELALQRIPIAAELAAEDIGTVLGNAPEKFKENLNAAGSLFPGLEAQAAALAEKQEEVAKAAENLPPALTSANNSAVPLAENSLLFSQNIQSGSNAASSAKSSLDALAGSAGSLKTETSGAATNLQTVGQMADQIAQKKMDQGARDLNAEIKGVQSEYRAFMAALGIYVAPNVSLEGIISDLGLTSAGLDSTDIKLEQVKRSLDALSQTPVADLTPALDQMGTSNKITEIGGILRENFQGLDVTPYIDREAIGEGVASTKDTIESALKEFKATVTLDPQVQEGVEQIKQTLDSEFSDPTKLSLDGEDSVSQVKQSAESNFAESIPLNLDGQESIDAAKSFADSTFSESTQLNLNADESIGKIKDSLKEQIDLAIGSSEGTAHLSSIDQLVSKIEQLVSKISEKLPMQALSY